MEYFTIYTPYIIGFALLYVGLLLQFNPPETINKRINLPISPAMLNVDTFQAACRFLAKWMIIIGGSSLLIGFILNQPYFIDNWDKAMVKRTNILLVLLCSTIPMMVLMVGVSLHLNQHFDRNGQRKNR